MAPYMTPPVLPSATRGREINSSVCCDLSTRGWVHAAPPDRKGFNVNYNTGGTFVVMVYSRKCANSSLEERFDWRIEGGRDSLHGYHYKSGV